MKYKLLLTVLVALVMVLSVSAMVPLASGNQANPDAQPAHPSSSHSPHMQNHGAKLTYNPTTGNITGQYLTANFNSLTGIFSNVTYNMTSTTLIKEMYGNGTSFGFMNKISNSIYPSHSRAMGNMFISINSSSLFVMHNNPAMESNMIVNNGSLYLHIPHNAKISNTTDNMQVNTSANAKMNLQANSTTKNSADVNHTMVNFNNIINAGRDFITIDNNGTIAMIFVHNGNFTITGHKIKITSAKNGTAFVNMVVPPGLQKIKDNGIIMHGIMQGRISSELALNYVNGTRTNSTINYNSSTHLTYIGNTSSTNSFDVNSSVNHHTIVAAFIDNNITKNTGHAYVKFDGKLATYVNMSTLVNETSSTHAYYSYTNSSSGMYVLMYVPHFSNHTIVVSNVPFQNVTNYTGYYIIGGVIAALALIGVAAYVIKKRK
jgi:hypothetical protein